MTSQLQYIITEKELRWYEGLITSEQSERYAKTIRSRPTKSDKVLEELVKWLEYKTSRYRNAYFTQVLEYIAELQQKEREQL